MSTIKSFSVGDGDMYYINHGSDNFTVIDCYLSEKNKIRITDEILSLAAKKEVIRFISTHPDDDHIAGLEYLHGRMGIRNFYCVKNEASKKDGTVDFSKYCELRDSDKAFYIQKGCKRKWMNEKDEERGGSGINILWPQRDNKYFQEALAKAKNGESPNNISPIIKYSLDNGIKALWMGDLEHNFMNNIIDELNITNIDVLFAPHHGRDTGKVPSELLKQMKPKLIVVGEAPSCHLNYYPGYNTITQNTAGDITFDCVTNKVHIYVSNNKYKVAFLDDEKMTARNYYLGTLNL